VLVLAVMVCVLLVEICVRWVMALPFYYRGWANLHPKPAAFMELSQNPILWQLVQARPAKPPSPSHLFLKEYTGFYSMLRLVILFFGLRACALSTA
jgi:hypothetical protein